MTPNWHQAIAALAIAVLSGAVACVSTPADAEDAGPATVAASDGALELSIPLSALPEGVAPSDLSITTLAPIEVIDPFDSETAEVAATAREIARFDLQPSGLHFEQPVAVTARLPLDAVTGPLVAYLVADDGSVELLPVSTTIEGETVVATTEVEHFSEIVWSVIGFREFFAMVNPHFSNDDDNVLVGDTIYVEFNLERLQGEQTVEMELIGRKSGGIETITALVPYIVNVGDGPWQLRGVFSSRGDEVLSPSFDPEPPGEWTVSSTDEVTKRGTFTCRDVGHWEIWFGGAIQLTYEAWPQGSLEGAELPTFEDGNHIQVLQPVMIDGRCVAPDSPPVLATENIPPNVFPVDSVLSPPMTIYTVLASDPERGALTYAWSGANCGSTWGETSVFYAWTHEGDDCDHTTTAHPDATIAVTVSDGVWQVTCTYQGAASCSGEACEAPAQVQ